MVLKNNIFILFSVIFLSLMIVNYYLNRSFVREILANEQLGMLKNSSEKIQKYFENKRLSLQAICELISKFDYEKDQSLIEDILNKSQHIANFSSVYVGYENNTMLSSKAFSMPPNYVTTERPWYLNAIKSDKIYITKPYIDTGLKIPVISISRSIKKDGRIIGVLCGVISIYDIKSKILDLRLANGEIFLTDRNFSPLFEESPNFAKFTNFDLSKLDLNKTLNFESKDEIVNFKPLENSQLILVAKTPKKNIYSKINEQFIVNLAIYAFSIVLFLILVYFYNQKFQKQAEIFEQHEREYEILLFQQTKMAELGQMISALSHQWVQPLNSLGIFLGNLVQLKKIGRLSDEIFYENIKRSFKNIDYMSKTMDLFKNFYKNQGKIERFDIVKAVNETICILFPTKQIDIKVTLSKTGADFICENYINEFKQIIACLIQNSKQILENDIKKSKKTIININKNSSHFIIRVIDNGAGIKENFLKNIFTPFKSTKGSSGLGLYISRLIARKKCGGDLFVSRAKNPTIFTLIISKRLKNDR